MAHVATTSSRVRETDLSIKIGTWKTIFGDKAL